MDHSSQNSLFSHPNVGRWALWAGVVAVLILNVPVFLHQQLTADAIYFDLQAKCVQNGGVMYRDMVEPNLPGVVWIHLLVRSIAGWSSVSLRGFDLLVLTGSIALLCRLARREGDALLSARSAAISLVVYVLYFSVMEWCHCQRDMWMLLPALGALSIRCRLANLDSGLQTAQDDGSVSRPIHEVLWSLFEGMLWGFAFWIKPHIALPALCVLGASAWMVPSWKQFGKQFASVVVGGAIVGALGSAWMIQTGTWAHFWEMQLEWNPEYLSNGRRMVTYDSLMFFSRLYTPWSYAHWFVIPTICVAIVHYRRQLENAAEQAVQRTACVRTILLFAMYFGWAIQVMVLQYPFAYVQTPVLILALGIVGTWKLSIEYCNYGWMAFALGCALIMVETPARQPGRFAAWIPAMQGKTDEVRILVQSDMNPDWKNMRAVIDFLKEQDLNEGEVTVYTGELVGIYPELGMMPSTRFVYVDVLARLFKSRTESIHNALDSSSQKYIVSSLRQTGMKPDAIADPIDPSTNLPGCLPPEAFEAFPFNQPVVFHAGGYSVHKVSGPVGELCTEYCPLKDVQAVSTERRGNSG